MKRKKKTRKRRNEEKMIENEKRKEKCVLRFVLCEIFPTVCKEE